jgi:prepilin peptidase CpaA
MPGLATIVFEVAGLAGLVAAAIWDVHARLLPNRLVAAVALVGFVARLISSGWTAGLSLLVAFGLLVVLGELSAWDLIGGGDAKLIAASTLLVPPSKVFELILVISLCGGALALVALVWALPAWRKGDWIAILQRPSLPFGVAIATGATLTVLRGLV